MRKFWFGRVLLLCVLLAGVSVPAQTAERTFFLRDGQRVLFLGDSITNSGGYVQYVETYLATRFPGRRFDVINLGLSSEGVTGLSETDHPFPRPNVHDRLQSALEKTRPDVVVACYGMNDGIYHPFGAERFRKYQDGIRRLVELSQKAGARVVLMTSPPFDALPVRDKTQPAGAPDYSYKAPFAGYDDVLARYSEWLLTLRSRDLQVVDLHGPVRRFVRKRRTSDPNYTLAGDGIHPNQNGHWLIAQELLQAWQAPASVSVAEIGVAQGRGRSGQIILTASNAGEMTVRWVTGLPLPLDPQWDERLPEMQQINERLNQHRLVVKGLSAPRYTLFEGETRLADVSREDLARGLDLTRYPALSTNQKALRVLELVRRRERLLSAAWLSHVGHNRPGTRPGLPLEQARREAEPLTEEIRRLARPATLELVLKPAR